jgi:holo-[acyl-carrier protein] synthase
MRILCGTDIIEIDRIRKSIEKNGDKFLNSVYTAKEIEYCEGRKNAKYNHYAGRFAAKEAIYKAISQLLPEKFGISWKDVQVVNDENGNPKIEFLNITFNQIKSTDISISHCQEYAVAMVTLIVDE